jgi:tol-pal system protein YbgF
MTKTHVHRGGFRCGSEFPIFYVGLLILGLLLSGCATRKEILQFQTDFEYVKAKLDTISINQQNLRMQVDGLQIRQDRLVDEMVTQSDMRQYKAYMGSRMDDYEGQALMISAQINDLSQRLTGVAQAMDEWRYKQPAEPTIADSADMARAAEQPEIRELYDQAYTDLTRGNYELAKSGFAEYLRLYADTELADNALYWMGETEYVQHNYEEALSTFARVIADYPQGNKVPAALFKVGLCQLALANAEEAKTSFQRLIQEHPATPEASQAEERLKEME